MSDAYIECVLFPLFAISVGTFILYAVDKGLAERDKSRIPEVLLILFALAFGAFGALCGMVLCRHKTDSLLFKICVPLFLYVQLAILILIRMDIIPL